MLVLSATCHCERERESKERGDGRLVGVRGRCGGSSSQQLAHDGELELELGSRGGGRGRGRGAHAALAPDAKTRGLLRFSRD